MVTRIRKGAKPHFYIEEHMKALGLNYGDLGNRMDVSATTVWRWAKEQHRLDPGKIGAIADALHMDYRDLLRPPARPSIDAMLDDAPENVYEATIDLVRRLTKRAS